MLEPYDRRRAADAVLEADATAIARDRSQPWRRRFYARLVAFVFRLRIRFGWHGDPGRSLRIPIYGRYCGPGVSTSGPPIDPLDSVCRTHDLEYLLARRVDTAGR